jgi:hypothetical protein
VTLNHFYSITCAKASNRERLIRTQDRFHPKKQDRGIIGIHLRGQSKLPKEIPMKREEGLWTDHHHKGTLIIGKEALRPREIRLTVKKTIRLAGERLAKKRNVPATSIPKDVSDRRYEDQLNCFYDGVVSLLRNANSIWIFGPGEMKIVLKMPLKATED